MLKVLVASDSFKGTLTSKDVAEAFSEVVKEFAPERFEIVEMLLADGGEGTLDALSACGKYVEKRAICHGPLFEKREARYLISGDEAIIEMAECSGLMLLSPRQCSAKATTSYGTGEVIRQAIEGGAKNIYVFVGGSASNDGGIGALAALGFEFVDGRGYPIVPTGENLSQIVGVRRTKNLTGGVKFTVLSDVDNPLVGPNGATYVYSRQKGASPSDTDMLEKGMQNYADVTEKITGVKLHDKLGAGAAGGLAGGFVAYLKADVKSGAECVLSLNDFEKKASAADAVITGEGKLDGQSLRGKTVFKVCAAAKRAGVPVYAVVGINELDRAECEKLGIKTAVALSEAASSKRDSVLNAKRHLRTVAKKLLQAIESNSNNRINQN